MDNETRPSAAPIRDLRAALKERSGSVAILFALAAVPLMLALGVAADYARTASLKSRLQQAADAAVLSAGARSALTQAARQQIVLNALQANLGSLASTVNLQATESEPLPGTYTVNVTATLPTTVMKIAHINSLNVSVTSTAQTIGVSSQAPLELALALDNTGSMMNNMSDLKSAATTLVQTVMSAGQNGSVRVSVVPYVAAVNPGLTDMSMVDTTAGSPWNGNWYVWTWLTQNSGCTPNWGSSSGGGGSGGAGAGGSGDANDLIEMINPFRRIAQELFGVASAHAASSGITPNTIPPLLTYSWKSPQTKKTYTVPNGFLTVGKDIWGLHSTGGCEWLENPGPGVISNYDLFSRVMTSTGKAATWKGCVEARPTKTDVSWYNGTYGTSLTASQDYDVTDTPPSASDPLSKFVPYFWPDEPDYSPFTWSTVAAGAYSSTTKGFHNNYLYDGTIPNNWGWAALSYPNWSGGQYLLKYDGTTKAAIIQETPDAAGYTYGPNAGCPDPVVRLTNNQGNVISAISNLNYWMSGGTVISEGLMWAWRTLSPNAPYSDGKAYNTPGVQKVIVLMTDGVNELIDNGNNSTSINTPNVSDYSAYGYLGANRLWSANSAQTYTAAATYFDNRLTAACTNAKAAGVKIYTVMFNHAGFLTTAQQNHVTSLLQQCASQPTYAYLATDSVSLNSAFSAIASSATAAPLHLTK
ncbi:TadE/TadG family type IV pilus assembly protein [Methylocystis heyeri]|nr:pilus assembly protein [Methylocystis heyeri]